MIQVRNNVFETNSSSSHSISIRKMNEYYTEEDLREDFPWVDRDGELYLYENDLTFGRSPFQPLTTFYAKVLFAIASYAHDKDSREEVESILKEVYPSIKSIRYSMTLDWKTNERVQYYGDIDHQSSGLLQGFLGKNNVSIREFLTNKKYVVFIDGDEYNITERLFKCGLINKDDFEKVGCLE